jgi:hypothetical protein
MRQAPSQPGKNCRANPAALPHNPAKTAGSKSLRQKAPGGKKRPAAGFAGLHKMPVNSGKILARTLHSTVGRGNPSPVQAEPVPIPQHAARSFFQWL